jgi:hypothetical protein
MEVNGEAAMVPEWVMEVVRGRSSSGTMEYLLITSLSGQHLSWSGAWLVKRQAQPARRCTLQLVASEYSDVRVRTSRPPYRSTRTAYSVPSYVGCSKGSLYSPRRNVSFPILVGISSSRASVLVKKPLGIDHAPVLSSCGGHALPGRAWCTTG